MRAIAQVARFLGGFMAPRISTVPRKSAKQARSRDTIDALLTATARVLMRDGFDKASTNRIAETAGVSVGSLYQYFPSKEALVVAVMERHNRELMQVVRGALAQVAALPVEQAVPKLVAAAIKAHRIDPELHRALAEQTPRTGRLANIEAFNRDNYVLFRGYLEAHRG